MNEYDEKHMRLIAQRDAALSRAEKAESEREQLRAERTEQWDKRRALEREAHALRAQLTAAKAAARVLAQRIDDLGMAADDNDPRVMATAAPLGAAEAELWIALGVYDEECARREKESHRG